MLVSTIVTFQDKALIFWGVVFHRTGSNDFYKESNEMELTLHTS